MNPNFKSIQNEALFAYSAHLFSSLFVSLIRVSMVFVRVTIYHGNRLRAIKDEEFGYAVSTGPYSLICKYVHRYAITCRVTKKLDSCFVRWVPNVYKKCIIVASAHISDEL